MRGLDWTAQHRKLATANHQLVVLLQADRRAVLCCCKGTSHEWLACRATGK